MEENKEQASIQSEKEQPVEAPLSPMKKKNMKGVRHHKKNIKGVRHHKKKVKGARHHKRQIGITAAAILLIAAVLGLGYWQLTSRTDGIEMEELSYKETALDQMITKAERDAELAEAIKNFGETAEKMENLGQPDEDADEEKETDPEDELILLTESNTHNFVKDPSVKILDGGTQFAMSGHVDKKPRSVDDFFYLFSLRPYENSIPEGRKPIAQVVKSLDFSLRSDVHENSAESQLFNKFVVAVLQEDGYTALCDPQYITNPEKLSSFTSGSFNQNSIKGLLVDPLKIRSGELEDLGICHAAYNIPISNILGNTTHGAYPTIHYEYNGKTYAFNGQRINEYDYVFRELTARGITISAILLNNNNGTQPQLIHPDSRGGHGLYYAFNAADDAGIETIAAVGAFLSRRYRDREHGIVMNWIIGNEVNVRESWNYMKKTDLEHYTQAYADAYRVFYNSIRSMNANARVYMPLDQQWDRNMEKNPNYDGRDMLDMFAKLMRREGDIYWSLAHHPYAVPLTDTTFYKHGTKYVTQSENSSFITMQNIGILTGYMQKDALRAPDGSVRHIILSELGYSSTKGELQQATAITYAFYAAQANPYIDAFILSRQTDAHEEIAQDLAVGLSHPGGGHKYAYEIYKQIDKPGGDAVTQFAKDMIGITSWSQVGIAH